MANNRLPTFYSAAYLVLLKDDSVLLMRRGNTGWMDGHWAMPQGHVEGKEQIAEALRREVKEELGITIAEKDMTLGHIMHRVGERVYFDFFFTATKWKGEIVNNEPDKHDKVEWFPLNSLPENLLPYLKRLLKRIQKGIIFSEDVTG